MAKKFLTLFMVGIMAVISALTLVGCKPKKQEIGMFICQKVGNEWNVLDLSEEGKQQSVIIMPKTILGESYYVHDRGNLWGVAESEWSDNDKLERLYFEYFYLYNVEGIGNIKGIVQVDLSLKDYPNLKKILSNHIYNKMDVRDYNKYEYYHHRVNSYTVYGNSRIMPNVLDDNGQPTGEKYLVRQNVQMANVQFMWNFENAANDGYYWVDDIEDGEKIEIIPDVPERDGYIFGGWYCESECINEWSFDTPIRKQELTEREYEGETVSVYPSDYVTFIYAKWIKGE
ncbi:MAG: InlB B-repeat-containing protein [Clostridia bacterium]|nr:InlB B-repeat-containing protein [Clostridia bacterium]MBR1675770.1 InlB B-repeat-containing protein [Clostridia bacterium]